MCKETSVKGHFDFTDKFLRRRRRAAFFIIKGKDFEKGDEMPCSLPRSCTKVPQEGKNTANAQDLI